MRKRASFDSSCWRQTPAASKEARPQWRSHAVSTFDEQNWAVSVSAINRARDLLRLTLDRVEQPLTCLFGLFVLRHLSLLLTSIDTPQKEFGGFEAVCAARPDGDGTSAD